MKIVKYSLFGLLVILTATVAGGLAWLQTADLGTLVTSQVQKNTGLTLKAEGPFTVKLFPNVRVEAGKLTLSGPKGDVLALDSASVLVKWGNLPFFWQGLNIVHVDVKNPTLTLHQYADGSTNWALPKAAETAEKKTAETTSKPFALPAYQYGTVTISNLNATYQNDAKGQKIAAKGINFTINGTNLAQTVASLTGDINGHALKAGAEADLTHLASIPLTANLSAAGLEAKVTATAEPNTGVFSGQVNAGTPNLKATLESLLGKAPEGAAAEAFRLQAKLQNRPGNLTIDQADVAYGQLLQASAHGTVQYQGGVAADADIKAAGSNLRALASTLGQNNPSIPASPFKLSGSLKGKESLKVENLTFELPGLATVGANATVTPGKQPLATGDARLQAPSLAALLKAVGKAGPAPSTPLNFTTDFTYGPTLKLTQTQGNIGQLLALEADMEVTPTPLNLNGKVKISGNNMAALAGAFGAKGTPSSPFSANVTVAGGKTINLNPLEINLPGLVEASGNVALTPGTPLGVKGKLEATTLNLTALGYCKEAPKPAASTPATTKQQTAGGAPWTDTPINVQGLKAVNISFAANLKNITCASVPTLKSSVVSLENAGNHLQISGAKLAFATGSLTADALLDYTSTPKLSLHLTGEGLPVEDFVSTLKAKGGKIPLSLKADLTTMGGTSRALAKSLAGNVKLNSANATFPFGNMLGGAATIDKLLTGQGLSAATNTSSGGDNLTADYKVSQGVATAETFKIATGDGSMDILGTGTIDLPNWYIDTTLTPTLHGQKGKLEIPLNIKGALTSPSFTPDQAVIQKVTGKLAGQALQKALGLDKTTGAAVGNLLSGQGVTSETVGNLLKAFGK